MKLIVGLGNPGTEYEMTRHNAGFLAIDYVLEKWKTENRVSDIKTVKTKQYEAFETQYVFDDGSKESLTLLKPLTFMNSSGSAIQAYCALHNDIDISEDLWVLHDELDVPFGFLKVAYNRSAAGQNGVQNIIDQLGTKEFSRIRIGIGSQHARKGPSQDYVLKNFSATESTVEVDVSSYSSGAYVIKINTDKSKGYVGKFVKK